MVSVSGIEQQARFLAHEELEWEIFEEAIEGGYHMIDVQKLVYQMDLIVAIKGEDVFLIHEQLGEIARRDPLFPVILQLLQVELPYFPIAESHEVLTTPLR